MDDKEHTENVVNDISEIIDSAYQYFVGGSEKEPRPDRKSASPPKVKLNTDCDMAISYNDVCYASPETLLLKSPPKQSPGPCSVTTGTPRTGSDAKSLEEGATPCIKSEENSEKGDKKEMMSVKKVDIPGDGNITEIIIDGLDFNDKVEKSKSPSKDELGLVKEIEKSSSPVRSTPCNIEDGEIKRVISPPRPAESPKFTVSPLTSSRADEHNGLSSFYSKRYTVHQFEMQTPTFRIPQISLQKSRPLVVQASSSNTAFSKKSEEKPRRLPQLAPEKTPEISMLRGAVAIIP